MEGLVVPSKLYAALATGRPVGVICEKHSYLRELIADANCGTAVDNGDAVALAKFIQQLAADSNLAKKMGKAGRRYLEAYLTPEIIAKQYSKVFYQAVLEEFPEPDSISSLPKAVPVRAKSLTTLVSAFKRHQD
jgi:glycosyltransferase involved in cell wall biosynthesis